MPRIKLPNSQITFSASSPAQAIAEQALINARHAFVVAQCRERGWPEDPNELTIDQILEIRAMPGWEKPC
jgi:hypothetical protein